MSKYKACAYKSLAIRDPLEVTKPHTYLGYQSSGEPAQRTQHINSELQVSFPKGFKRTLTHNFDMYLVGFHHGGGKPDSS